MRLFRILHPFFLGTWIFAHALSALAVFFWSAIQSNVWEERGSKELLRIVNKLYVELSVPDRLQVSPLLLMALVWLAIVVVLVLAHYFFRLLTKILDSESSTSYAEQSFFETVGSREMYVSILSLVTLFVVLSNLGSEYVLLVYVFVVLCAFCEATHPDRYSPHPKFLAMKHFPKKLLSILLGGLIFAVFAALSYLLRKLTKSWIWIAQVPIEVGLHVLSVLTWILGTAVFLFGLSHTLSRQNRFRIFEKAYLNAFLQLEYRNTLFLLWTVFPTLISLTVLRTWVAPYYTRPGQNFAPEFRFFVSVADWFASHWWMLVPIYFLCFSFPSSVRLLLKLDSKRA